MGELPSTIKNSSIFCSSAKLVELSYKLSKINILKLNVIQEKYLGKLSFATERC